MGKDYYSVLGVPKDAKDDDLKKVWCTGLNSCGATPSCPQAGQNTSL